MLVTFSSINRFSTWYVSKNTMLAKDAELASYKYWLMRYNSIGAKLLRIGKAIMQLHWPIAWQDSIEHQAWQKESASIRETLANALRQSRAIVMVACDMLNDSIQSQEHLECIVSSVELRLQYRAWNENGMPDLYEYP